MASPARQSNKQRTGGNKLPINITRRSAWSAGPPQSQRSSIGSSSLGGAAAVETTLQTINTAAVKDNAEKDDAVAQESYPYVPPGVRPIPASSTATPLTTTATTSRSPVSRESQSYVPPGARPSPTSTQTTLSTTPSISGTPSGTDARGPQAYVPPGARTTPASTVTTSSTTAGFLDRSSDPIGETSSTSRNESNTLNSFREFVVSEKERLSKKKALINAKDRDARLADLVRFSKEFKLNRPIPDDLAPVLAKREEKQDALVEKSKQDAISPGVRDDHTVNATASPSDPSIVTANSSTDAVLAFATAQQAPASGPDVAGLPSASTINVSISASSIAPITTATVSSSSSSSMALDASTPYRIHIQKIPPFKGKHRLFPRQMAGELHITLDTTIRSSATNLQFQLPSLLRLVLTRDEISAATQIIETDPLMSHKQYLALLLDLTRSHPTWLPRVGDELQKLLDNSGSVPEQRQAAVRLLYDLNSHCGILPSTYWLDGVSTTRILGRGGEAVIFEGRYQNQPVAVRRAFPPTSDAGGWDSVEGQKILKFVRREIIAHRQLSHPNVLGLIGAARTSDPTECPIMMVLKLHPQELRAYLKQNPSPEVFLHTLGGISHGLGYLHSRSPPLIHGDLHPGNILVDLTGTPIICDFGLSRWQFDKIRSLTDARATENSWYIAPELFAEDSEVQITERTDVYAFSILIYSLTYRRTPFDKSNLLALSRIVPRGERPIRPTLSPNSLPWASSSVESSLWTLMQQMWSDELTRLPLREAHAKICELRGVDGRCPEWMDSSPTVITARAEYPAAKKEGNGTDDRIDDTIATSGEAAKKLSKKTARRAAQRLKKAGKAEDSVGAVGTNGRQLSEEEREEWQRLELIKIDEHIRKVAAQEARVTAADGK